MDENQHHIHAWVERTLTRLREIEASQEDARAKAVTSIRQRVFLAARDVCDVSSTRNASRDSSPGSVVPEPRAMRTSGSELGTRTPIHKVSFELALGLASNGICSVL